MTLGEKIKEARKQAALSQEELAEKLNISRSAVAKWETDKGIPDIENLKALSQLLSVSIDYLLDQGESLDKAVIKEAIDLSKYQKGSRYKKKNLIVREKYPKGKIIPLLAETKLEKSEKVIDYLIAIIFNGPFGVPSLINSIKKVNEQYYLVEQNDKQFLVMIDDEFILSRELVQKHYEKKFEIGNIKFTRCKYEVK